MRLHGTYQRDHDVDVVGWTRVVVYKRNMEPSQVIEAAKARIFPSTTYQEATRPCCPVLQRILRARGSVRSEAVVFLTIVAFAGRSNQIALYVTRNECGHCAGSKPTKGTATEGQVAPETVAPIQEIWFIVDCRDKG